MILDSEFRPRVGSGVRRGGAPSSFAPGSRSPLRGAQGIVYHGAMRGAHIDAITTELGLLTIPNKVHAAEVHVRKGQEKGGRRRPGAPDRPRKRSASPTAVQALPIYSGRGGRDREAQRDGRHGLRPARARVRTQRHGNRRGRLPVLRNYQYRLPIGVRRGRDTRSACTGNEVDKKQRS